MQDDGSHLHFLLGIEGKGFFDVFLWLLATYHIEVVHATAKEHANDEVGGYITFDELYNNMWVM